MKIAFPMSSSSSPCIINHLKSSIVGNWNEDFFLLLLVLIIPKKKKTDKNKNKIEICLYSKFFKYIFIILGSNFCSVNSISITYISSSLFPLSYCYYIILNFDYFYCCLIQYFSLIYLMCVSIGMLQYDSDVICSPVLHML